ncbi:MAG TPA: hypothetical protein PKB14_03070 [Rubrivivax sp.]|nr:hypothetical protein [Rubrivivax sp.]
MPYFVYAVRPFAQLDQLGEHAAFRDASAQAKALRAAPGADPQAAIRVMFAADQGAAEDLLLQLRSPAPQPDD